MSAAPPIKHPKLRQLYEYWNDKRGARAMPARADLDPLDMTFVMGNIVLVDVIEGEAPRFRIRLYGTNLTEQARIEMTGKMLDELPLSGFRNLTQQSLMQVVRTKQLFHAQRDQVLDGRRRVYEAIILPLSGDGDRIDRILCGMFYSYRDRR